MSVNTIKDNDISFPDKDNSKFIIETMTCNNISSEQDIMYEDNNTKMFYIKGCDKPINFDDLSFPRLSCDKLGNLTERRWSDNSLFRDNDCAWRASNAWLPLFGTSKQRYTGIKQYIIRNKLIQGDSIFSNLNNDIVMLNCLVVWMKD
jgi:hypothetical protein